VDGRLQFSDAPLERGDAFVTLLTTRTEYLSHDGIAARRQGGSCAPQSDERLPPRKGEGLWATRLDQRL
jgi:hypothetical protein